MLQKQPFCKIGSCIDKGILAFIEALRGRKYRKIVHGAISRGRKESGKTLCKFV